MLTLPLFLPSTLAQYSKAENETDLFQQLSKDPKDFVLFFECAAEDETWSERHSQFMKKAICWLTEQSFQEQLPIWLAERVVTAIQTHFHLLHPHIPYNLTFNLDGGSVEVNSLFFEASSPLFHNLIRREYKNHETASITWKELPYQQFQLVAEFIHVGAVKTLWKLQQSDLFALLNSATRIGLSGLALQCQETLKRYIDSENALEMLIQAHTHSWSLLKQTCIEVLNDLSLGVRFPLNQESNSGTHRKLKPLVMEFLEFSEDSLHLFSRLHSLLTHLICSGTLTEYPAFSDVMKKCPKLIGLDISRSRIFSDRLFDIPAHLEELDLSKCPWLTNGVLKQIVGVCPHLSYLSLASNPQLSSVGWGALQAETSLKALDISRCHQVRDEDFALILRACPHLIELNLEECDKLTDQAFFEIARSLSQLIGLNLSHCSITNGLLAEILSRCRFLQRLDLTRCLEITERGLLQALKPASALRELTLRHCRIPASALEEIKQQHPLLSLLI